MIPGNSYSTTGRNHPIKGIRRLLGLGLFAVLSVAQAQNMPEGVAVVTGVLQPVDWSRPEAGSVHPKLNDTTRIQGRSLRTGKGAHLFLALSNGLAIGIGENSELDVDVYQQTPFSERRESLDYEPSVSQLSLRLKHGVLAVATNRLSPLSQARIALPSGQVRIHSGVALFSAGDTGMHLTALEGTLTYYYPEGAHREFLAAPQSIRLTEQSARQNRIAATPTIEDMPDEWKHLAQATRHASRRVFFQAAEEGAAPRPVRIVSPEYFKQVPVRPYEFSD